MNYYVGTYLGIKLQNVKAIKNIIKLLCDIQSYSTDNYFVKCNHY